MTEIEWLRAECAVDDESLWACRDALLAVVEAAEEQRRQAQSALDYQRLRASGGQIVGSPKMAPSTALRIVRELGPALDTLRARVREVRGE